AVACVATNAGTLPWVLLVQHDAQRRMKRSQTRTGEIVGQVLDARLVTDRRPRIWFSSGWFSRIVPAVSVDLVKLLGLTVIRFQVVVGDWPGGRNTAVMPNLAKILLPKAEKSSSVELCVAAHIVVSVRMQVTALNVAPDFLCAA